MSLNQNKAKRKQMEAANVIIESFGIFESNSII